MFQPTVVDDLTDFSQKITVAEGLTVALFDITIVADGVELYPDQEVDQTSKVLNAQTLAFMVDGTEYPIPTYADIEDDQVQALMETMLYPE